MPTQERKDAKLKGADPSGGNVKQWERHVGGRVGFSACRRGAMKGPCCTDSLLLVQPRIEAQDRSPGSGGFSHFSYPDQDSPQACSHADPNKPSSMYLETPH